MFKLLTVKKIKIMDIRNLIKNVKSQLTKLKVVGMLGFGTWVAQNKYQFPTIKYCSVLKQNCTIKQT